ncbi:hypothetical protein HMSSN036_14730 [Paenibacillus macerans]|nr:hypothetical protein HMSSN036_14730 [Paenibacillus macerans]
MKVVIADDHAVVRSGFAMIINFQEDMEVVATAADGIEAYKMVAKHRPDILLMDLSMPPGESGLIATAKINEDFPDTKIIILTMYDDEEYLFHVLKNGAKGYVLKNAPDEQLVSAIRMVHQGGVYIHPKLATSLVREFINQNQEADESSPYRIYPPARSRFCRWWPRATAIRKSPRCCIFP